MHGDGVEDPLDRCAAHLADGNGVIAHALDDFELMPVLAAIFVGRHSFDYMEGVRPFRGATRGWRAEKCPLVANLAASARPPGHCECCAARPVAEAPCDRRAAIPSRCAR